MAIKAIIGLGNIGNEYQRHRHNIGFLCIDRLVDTTLHGNIFKQKFHGQFQEIILHTHKLKILKPSTYMNLSGKSVLALQQYYKLNAEEILVIHDELDLPFGKTKIKQGGSDAGHNGLRDITSCLGSDYYRLRLGIGRPENKNLVSRHVLSDFTKEEWTYLADWFEKIIKNSEYLLHNDHTQFIANVNNTNI